MTQEEYALAVQQLRARLYRTAFLYLGSEALALDAVDEAVYKGLRGLHKLRQPEFFTTWLTRILLNECCREQKRQRRFQPLEDREGPDGGLDALPLKEAILRLSPELSQVVILRYFSGYTLAETARILEIPPGTAATRQRRALALLRLELCEKEGDA